MKYLKTPLYVLSGSLNFLVAGVHGRTQEATNHFLTEATDYEDVAEGIDNLLASSYPYDTEQGPRLRTGGHPRWTGFFKKLMSTKHSR